MNTSCQGVKYTYLFSGKNIHVMSQGTGVISYHLWLKSYITCTHAISLPSRKPALRDHCQHERPPALTHQNLSASCRDLHFNHISTCPQRSYRPGSTALAISDIYICGLIVWTKRFMHCICRLNYTLSPKMLVTCIHTCILYFLKRSQWNCIWSA